MAAWRRLAELKLRTAATRVPDFVQCARLGSARCSGCRLVGHACRMRGRETPPPARFQAARSSRSRLVVLNEPRLAGRAQHVPSEGTRVGAPRVSTDARRGSGRSSRRNRAFPAESLWWVLVNVLRERIPVTPHLEYRQPRPIRHGRPCRRATRADRETASHEHQPASRSCVRPARNRFGRWRRHRAVPD